MSQKLEKTKKFFRELQRSEKDRKKRWLVGLTVLAMVLVLILWSIYINATGLPVLAEKNPAAAPPAADSQSVWDVFQRGLSEIFRDAKGQLEISRNLIQEQFQKTNEVIVE